MQGNFEYVSVKLRLVWRYPVKYHIHTHHFIVDWYLTVQLKPYAVCRDSPYLFTVSNVSYTLLVHSPLFVLLCISNSSIAWTAQHRHSYGQLPMCAHTIHHHTNFNSILHMKCLNYKDLYDPNLTCFCYKVWRRHMLPLLTSILFNLRRDDNNR